MTNNESKTKVEQNDFKKNLDDAIAFIQVNPTLSLGGVKIYRMTSSFCVYRTFWGIRTIKQLTEICDAFGLSFKIETSEQILIYKS